MEIAPPMSFAVPGDVDRVARPKLSLRLKLHHGIILFAILLVALLANAADRQLGIYREHFRERGERDAANLALAFDAHIGRTIAGIDQALLMLRAEIERDPARIAELSRTLAEGPLGGLAFQIGAIDRRGYIAFSTVREATARPVYVGDREHFRFQFENPGDALFVSTPVKGRASGRWTLQFTRKLRDARGGFDGVVIIGVDPAELVAFHRSIDIGRRGSVALVGRDGISRVRTSASGIEIGEIVGDWPLLLALAERERGSYLTRSADGADTVLVSYRALAGSSLVVAVGVSEREQLAPYFELRATLHTRAGIAGGFLVLVLLFLAYQARRLQRADADLRQTETALRGNQVRLHDFAAASSDWFWERTASGELRFVAESSLETPGEPVSRRPAAPVPPEAARRDAARFIEPFAANRAAFRDGRIEYVDGRRRTRHLSLSGKPIVDDSGRLAGYRGTATDITAKIAAEAEAERMRRLLQAAIEAFDGGFAVFDGEERLVFWNAQFEAWHAELGARVAAGVSHAALIDDAGHAAPMPLAADRRAAWIKAWSALKREDHGSLESPWSGERWMWISHRRLAGEWSLCVMVDVTGLKRRELDLAAAKIGADEANRAKSTFLARMSHELRTPLNAIIGFSEAQTNQLFGPIGDARYLGYARDIRDSGRHLLGIINQLLDMSRAEAGRFDLEEEVFDPRLVAEEAIRLLAERAEAAGTAIRLDLPATLPCLRADRRLVKQMLINLLSNAVKFTPAGGRIALAAAVVEGGGLALRVADSGIGIAAKDIAVVLTPFGQIHSHLTRNHEGTGLGLTLVKTFIELHGGTLGLVSTLGEGTTVTLTFPRERVEPAPKPRADLAA
jgi:two-component system cell cycle sensor histidine kinase PleC